MLASTMQHSTPNHTPTPPTTTTPTHTQKLACASGCVRRSRPGAARKNTNRCLLRTQQCAKPQEPHRLPNYHESIVMFHPATPQHSGAWNQGKGEPQPEYRPRPEGRRWSRAGRPHHTGRLLRKEVIQPHLPVRLPCYDFVPIASPTFDNSLPRGVGPPASGVTDFRDVTGGVYKARERIHRSNADLRLLATPTSWGRVADPNPN